MKAVDFAIQELGKEEIPRGSNWGPDVQKYLHSVGINFPASWCAAFVYWCTEQAAHVNGIPNTLPKTGGVLMMWNMVDQKFKHSPLTTLEAGDIFIMNFGKGLGHTGFIESVDPDGTVHTIEGNTNDTGSREGYEVCRRKRTADKFVGIIRTGI